MIDRLIRELDDVPVIAILNPVNSGYFDHFIIGASRPRLPDVDGYVAIPLCHDDTDY